MYCPNCKKEQEGRSCPECGTKLIEKPAGKDGFNISLGDANAISGGMNLTDSHNVHNEDKSIHNITNTTSTVTNITNVSAQKTEMELLQERKTLYLNACKRAYEDNVLEQSEKIELDRYRLELGLDEATADILLEQVRQMTLRRAQKTELTGIGKIKLKQLTEALKKNEVQAIMRQIDSIEALAGKFANDELQYKYYLVLAGLRHEKCIEKFEKSKVDNYWKSFWSYFAYLKAEKPGKASEILYSLSDKFPSYPEDNITLLASAGSYFKNEKEEAHEFLNEVTGDYSPALQRFTETVYLLLEPEMAQDMGATEENCAFYLINFFGQEDPKIMAEKEARKKAFEEKRRLAEEEAKKILEQRAQWMAEKEARRESKEETRREDHEGQEKIHAIGLTIKNEWNGVAREACLLSSGMGMVVRGPREIIYTDSTLDIIAAISKLKKSYPKLRLRHFSFNSKGQYCAIYWGSLISNSDKWEGEVPPAMEKRLNEYISRGDVIYSVSLAENGDWAIVTDNSFAGVKRAREAAKKAGEIYGDQKSIALTDHGVVVCCEYGVYYENIPIGVIEKINECLRAGWIPTRVSFTDSGICFISNGKTGEENRCAFNF